MFKLGTKVYVINNSAWGLEPMVVISEPSVTGSVSCKHPSLGGGAFQNHTLRRASQISTIRKQKLRKYKSAEDIIRKLDKELFK